MNLAAQIANHILWLLNRQRRAVIAFDGPDAAGKTTLADSVASQLGDFAVRTSIDGFHRPSSERAARGSLSPEAYFLDTFDFTAFSAAVNAFVEGAPNVTTQTFDLTLDRPDPQSSAASPTAALLVDGVFLQRSEITVAWDFVVYLHVPEQVTVTRALQRDLDLFGDPETVIERYRSKYLPGQVMYRESSEPTKTAHLVVDNSAPAEPVVLADRVGRFTASPAPSDAAS